ncbi:cysteine-rich receptor-like protein kinase 25 [Corylus avellana]|uniref:cysteine-rich receptor-like protein kinase 25 n=1 Tax=Corylus avellana TaxID=13451 RepID=UPI001E212FFA|nr:cysteine-rich receptor-like protein kinase 25 [Corylus avellana]
MPSFNPFSLPIVLLYLLTFLNLTTHAAAQNYLYNICRNTTIAQNSIYSSNIKSLLSSLSSNATGNIEFYNTTAGQTTSNPVYGLFLCRGDVNAEICRKCVVNATRELAKSCAREKIAVTWYDECTVRYSNESIFSTVAVRPRVHGWNVKNVTEPDRFNRLVNTTMTQLAREASNFPIGVKKFGVKEVQFSDYENTYNLVQCTPDLSSTDCNSCLQAAINRFLIHSSGKQGGRVMFPSCNVRYELYLFYNVPTAPAPAAGLAPPPPPPAPIARSKGKNKISTATIVAIAVSIALSVVLLLFILGYCFLIRRKKYNAVEGDQIDSTNDITIVESLQFDFATIETATNKFSVHNKLGEGGFGAVYKGILPNGQEIAVKRLSRNSGQGAEQFKNEVVLVAKLQHKNLTRLLGFCLEGEEKILIYEFASNKSLDYFLYDPRKQAELDWSIRYKIIGGIARGIQYLHEDSRLRIIHRDLKASNVLLDVDMNPKISDFGMARIFGVDQTQGNTSRIVGT